MPAYVALLRGINLGSKRRVAMKDLRGLLERLGYEDVRTLLQSGNAVLRAPTRSASAVSTAVREAIRAELDMDVDVLVRTAAQLADVLERDPFEGRATDPARYMVVFLDKRLSLSALSDIDPGDFAPEELVTAGTELYLWLPQGLHDSRLARALTDRRLGGTWTMRNWNTVRKLGDMTGA